MVYLAGAYLVIWGILFGYIFSLQRRQKQLEQELDSLRADEEDEARR